MAAAPKRIYPGLKFEGTHFTAVQKLPDDKKTRSPNLRKRVKVKCVCGVELSLPVYYLIRTNPKTSCGCMNRGLATLHKLEYRVWVMMNVRCNDSRHRSYKEYGGRGIKVCPEWAKSNPHGFANFLKDMGPRQSIHLTLERLDVNGPYAPYHPETKKRQCIWATWDQQAQNKRKHLIPPPEEDPEAKEILELTDEDTKEGPNEGAPNAA